MTDLRDQAAARRLAEEWLEGKVNFDRRLAELIERRESDSSRSLRASRAYVGDVVTLFRRRAEELDRIVAAVPSAYAPILARYEDRIAALEDVQRRYTALVKDARSLKQEEEADTDAVKVKIKAEAGWDVESLEEACYRLRCGGASDLTRVFPTTYEAVASLPFPNLMPMHPIPPPAHRVTAHDGRDFMGYPKTTDAGLEGLQPAEFDTIGGRASFGPRLLVLIALIAFMIGGAVQGGQALVGWLGL